MMKRTKHFDRERNAEVTTYERNGQTWEVVSELEHTYWGKQACIQLDMRGDPETYFGSECIVIQAQDIGNGWVRYWYQSADPVLQTNNEELSRLIAYGRSRGWNK